MKALAVDSAVTRMTVAAKNDDKVCIAIYDIGMKQSETLLSAIDYVLEKAGISVSELDYTTLCAGPGSFTGLRLAFSALKAIELAHNVPVYGIPSLKVYAYPFCHHNGPVLSVIDAKKERFYSALFNHGNQILEDGDYEIPELCEKIKNYPEIFVCGPDTKIVKETLSAQLPEVRFIGPVLQPNTAECLFAITEEEIKNGTAPLKDFDGPIYLRASEAEVNLQSK